MLCPLTAFVDDLREGCAQVSASARWVKIEAAGEPYVTALLAEGDPHTAPRAQRRPREQTAAFWLILDAINFGSGWFPTLRKPPGRSGYQTIAEGLHASFSSDPWDAGRLQAMTRQEIAAVLGQDPQHELMGLLARSLRDLGHHVASDFDGHFTAIVDTARTSAVALASLLGGWDCFADTSSYGDIQLPFRKRAQLAAADLARAGAAGFDDLDRLTMFADNLVPHVLRLDGILVFDPGLVVRIERGELIPHGSAPEVEIRACALHAVELLAADSQVSPAQLDNLLWHRGQRPDYKAQPRHRSRSTAY